MIPKEAGAGVGIGVVFSGLITATARNPALRPFRGRYIFNYMQEHH